MDKKKQLILAILVFVGAFFGNQWYIDSQIDQFKEKKFVTVLRAKKSLDVGAMLSSAVVEGVRVPEQYAPNARVRYEDKDQYMQIPLATKVLAGDYILETAFTSVGVVGKTLSQQLEGDEFRAITMPVDETNSLARSLVTGDRIDIIFTYSLPNLRQKVSSILLQNVPIISTGSYSAASQELGDSSKGGRYSTLTLKLTAQDAARLNYARQAGTISLMLRSIRDNKILDLAPITNIQDLLSAADKTTLENMIRQEKQQWADEGEKYQNAIKEQAKVALEQQKKQMQNLSGIVNK
ncbi:MAG: Flp pilus assembly protein CpaB [Proteobacteria bacterium]|nr:Flp pilus assembly protein CpaB [Pseudomonadota bacterium]